MPLKQIAGRKTMPMVEQPVRDVFRSIFVANYFL